MATTKKDVTITDIVNKHTKGKPMTTTTTAQKVAKVGIRQIATSVPRFELEDIKSKVSKHDKKGSSVAPMYVLDSVK